MEHLMLDLETLGTEQDCPVLSIGAVKFDPRTGLLGDRFYSVLPLQEQFDIGRRMSASTFRWWMKQENDARYAIAKDDDPNSSVSEVIHDFRKYFKGATYIWSNGAGFDVPIIEDMMRQYKVTIPWKYYNIRDTRTAGHLAGVRLAKQGVAHNALDDAISQANWIHQCYQKLGRV
jgi:DNA polymerase III epsilon subunit-like protein